MCKNPKGIACSEDDELVLSLEVLPFGFLLCTQPGATTGWRDEYEESVGGEEEETEGQDWDHGQVPHLWARRGKEPSGRVAEAREVGGKGSEPWTREPHVGNVANYA